MKHLFLLLTIVCMIATSCQENGIKEPSNPIEQPSDDSRNDNVDEEGNKDDDNTTDEAPLDDENATEEEKPADDNVADEENKEDVENSDDDNINNGDKDGSDTNDDDNVNNDEADLTEYIKFADSNVKTICLTHWNLNDDAELSIAEAEAVTDIGTVFEYEPIMTFDELKYFTGITNINEEAFKSCDQLVKITIPNNVTSIRDYAFSDCYSMISITIPNSVTTIGTGAFVGCDSLKYVYCKAITPPTIEYNAFENNENNLKIYVPIESINTYKDTTGWGDYVHMLVGYDFENGRAIVDTTPEYNEIYYKNNSTTKATTPYNENAFGANILSNRYYTGKECWVITFDDDVTSIGEYAFINCQDLTSITFPDSVTTVGDYAFSNCHLLTQIGGLDNVLVIGDYSFYKCESLMDITLGDSITTIGNEAFRYCYSLTSITLPNSITTVEDYTFANCRNITNVILNNNLDSIGTFAFYNCYSLIDITLPNSLTIISHNAFMYCKDLESITIPHNVAVIEDNAFYGCENLTNVYCRPATPPILESSAFYYTASTLNIYVPINSLGEYSTSDGWKDYADAIVGYDFENGVVVE